MSIYLNASLSGKAIQLRCLNGEIQIAGDAGELFCHNPEFVSGLQVDAGVCRSRRGVLQQAGHQEGHRVVALAVRTLT